MYRTLGIDALFGLLDHRRVDVGSVYLDFIIVYMRPVLQQIECYRIRFFAG